MNLSEETLKKIDDVIPRYPEKRSAALMVIHLVQEELERLILKRPVDCRQVELQPINIRELITFYPMLRETAGVKPMFAFAELCLVHFGVVTRPVRNLKKNLESRRDMSQKTVNFPLNLWNVLQIVGKGLS